MQVDNVLVVLIERVSFLEGGGKWRSVVGLLKVFSGISCKFYE